MVELIDGKVVSYSHKPLVSSGQLYLKNRLFSSLFYSFFSVILLLHGQYYFHDPVAYFRAFLNYSCFNFSWQNFNILICLRILAVLMNWPLCYLIRLWTILWPPKFHHIPCLIIKYWISIQFMVLLLLVIWSSICTLN